jgi:hypothetical protein
MKTQKDIEVKICEVENEISKENAKNSPSTVRIKSLELTLSVLNWVLDN